MTARKLARIHSINDGHSPNAAVKVLFDLTSDRRKPAVVADHQQSARLTRGCHNLAKPILGSGERLFDEHVFAAPQSFGCEMRVRIVPGYYENRVRCFVIQYFFMTGR